MPALGDVLRRFRFHGVPGAPTVVAVPADRTAELEAELAPVFVALEVAQRSAADMVTAAERHARERRAAAVAEGQQIVAAARAGASAARDEAARARLERAESEARRVIQGGRTEAARVARTAAERVDAVAESVVMQIHAVVGLEAEEQSEL